MSENIQLRLLAISKHLKLLRESHNLTQWDIAKRLNTTQNAYSKIECGKTKMSLLMLLKIAEVYKIDIRSLLNSK